MSNTSSGASGLEGDRARSATAYLTVVMPVLNDWQSLERLIADLDATDAAARNTMRVVIVDDGSTEPISARWLDEMTLRHIAVVEVLHLSCNLGHQRAIAVGLAYTAREADEGVIIVMDSDGEDRADDLDELLRAHEDDPDAIIVAQRSERSEGLFFRVYYSIYKSVFGLLTGQAISFGNFSLLPIDALRRLLFMPSIWNNLAATYLRSRLVVKMVPTKRGRRYFGTSKMNLVSLILHGLSAMSVFIEPLLVRMLMFCLILASGGLLGILVALYIKFFTELATPGWATTLISAFAIIATQAVVMAMTTVFFVLSNRSISQIIPGKHALDYIGTTAQVWPRPQVATP